MLAVGFAANATDVHKLEISGVQAEHAEMVALHNDVQFT